MKEPTIDRQRTVVTHGQASVIAQPRIGALHDPAPLVSPQGSAVLRWRLAPSFTMRNDQFDAAPSQLLAQRIRSSFLLSSISPHLWFLVIQKPQFLLFTSTQSLTSAARSLPAPPPCKRRTSPASSRRAARYASRARRGRLPHVASRLPDRLLT